MPESHDDLIAELRALGGHLDVPEPADQRAAVRARLAKRRKARWRAWLIGCVVAVVGAVGAVEPARAGVIDAVTGLLRVAGIEVRTEPAPTALPASPSPLPSLRPAALAEAQRAVRFPVRAPAALGNPEEVLVADQNRVVTLTYRGGAVRFDQFDGRLNPIFLKQAPDAQWVEVGDIALWFPTAHALTYLDRDGVERTATARLAGPTLIWSVGAVSYRLEGVPTLQEAMRIASSVS